MALKAWVELVRLQTLGRQGLQQLQVDVHFLRPQLRRCAPACSLGDVFDPNSQLWHACRPGRLESEVMLDMRTGKRCVLLCWV